MCDTQVIRQDNVTYFAKNSDREASETQFIIRRPQIDGDKSKTLRTTHLNISQVPNRFGVILSKPFWIWGAEMGINDQGVVIGNEAVFTRLVEKHRCGLLGMDLVRLGLERGNTARAALQVITELLEVHGQGGVAGFRNRSFRYDNSYIIADPNEAWILETAGRCWVAKKVDSFAAISNALSIGSDFDLSSAGVEDFALRNGYFSGKGDFNFAKAFDSRFMPFMARSKDRQALSSRCLSKLHSGNSASLESLVRNLRTHHLENEDFSRHSNRDICLHGAGLTRPSQTCGSMVAAVKSNQPSEILLTATSAPCLSLYKPISFSYKDHRYLDQDNEEDVKSSLWYQFEWVHRRALKDRGFRDALKTSRDSLESRLMSVFSGSLNMQEADLLAKKWHDEWEKTARQVAPRYSQLSRYDRYWKKLNGLDGVF